MEADEQNKDKRYEVTEPEKYLLGVMAEVMAWWSEPRPENKKFRRGNRQILDSYINQITKQE